MRANAGIFILICLLFLVGTVGAVIPDSVTITSDKPAWIIANNVDQSTFTIFAVNSSTGVVENANVDFAINNTLGTLSSTSGITVSGKTSTTFKVKTTSGSTKITAIVHGTGVDASYTNTVTLTQNIDHDILIPEFTPTTGNVTEVITFNVSITDQWGNPIDNRRGDNTVSLSVTCPLPNDCNFVGYGHSFSSQPDSNGNLEIPLQLGTKTGVTTIVMSPVQGLSQQEAYIDTAPSGMVLTPTITPGTTVAVKIGIFQFVYKLLDDFGNPIPNKDIQIITSLGETIETKTTFSGLTPLLTYGPKSDIQNVTITATVVDNPSITNQFTVTFVNSEPEIIMLSVLPQTMGSLEYDPDSQANVVVRILDGFGNPVSGQDVTFTLTNTSTTTNWNISPSLTSYSGTTLADGTVKTVFKPGAFSITTTSNGTCELTATWNLKSKKATLSWTNRPFLNVITSVSPETTNLSEMVDVTITVFLKGEKGRYRPLTIMLDEDCSGSMKSMSEGHRRIQNAAYAATFLIDAMDITNTQMGLESYGYYQPPLTPLPILSGQDHFNLIKNNYAQLQGLSNSGGMGASIWRSLYNITAHANEEDVKVLILLSDGGSQLENNGDDLGDMIAYAKANNIICFPIAYLSGGGGGSAAVQMTRLANETGGKYYESDNTAGLVDAFKDITDRIQILQETPVNVHFDNMVIGNKTFTGTDTPYDYIPVGPFYTMNTTVNPNGRTSIIWTNGSQTVKDQSGEWPVLHFTIGDIGVGQQWSTTFRLKVNWEGCYNVFSNTSTLGEVALPELPLCVMNITPSKAFKIGTLNITGLPPSLGASTDFMPVQWNTDYNATVSTNIANEIVYYRINSVGAPWNQFATMTAPSGYSSQSTSIDIRNFRRGNYIIWVHATAGDADDADAYSTLTVGSASPYFIKLQ